MDDSTDLLRQYEEAYQRYREARDRVISVRPYDGGPISPPPTLANEGIENVVALHQAATRLHDEWVRALREGR